MLVFWCVMGVVGALIGGFILGGQGCFFGVVGVAIPGLTSELQGIFVVFN